MLKKQKYNDHNLDNALFFILYGTRYKQYNVTMSNKVLISTFLIGKHLLHMNSKHNMMVA